MANQHVVRRPGDRWAVRRANASRDTIVYDNQTEAFEAARDIAINQGGEVFIHGRDGRIRERNTYGKKDPFPPRG